MASRAERDRIYKEEFEHWKSKLPNGKFILKIVRKIEPINWTNIWVGSMDKTIGEEILIEDKSTLIFSLSLNTSQGYWGYPYQCFDILTVSKLKYFYGI
jgi:hypothetical protein